MKLHNYVIAAWLLVVGLTTSTPAQNLVQNGDFSINTAGNTVFNMSNAEFNAAVDFCTAFGTAQEADLAYGGGWGPFRRPGTQSWACIASSMGALTPFPRP